MSGYLCDVNVWLALAISRHLHHAGARKWLESIDEPSSVFFCRGTQQSLLRLLTNAAVLAPYGNPPLTNEAAWSAYAAFVADDRIVFRREPRGLEPIWQQYAVRPTASPKLWMDAYLAAHARADDSTLVTTDAAFSQFAGVDVQIIDGQRGT